LDASWTGREIIHEVDVQFAVVDVERGRLLAGMTIRGDAGRGAGKVTPPGGAVGGS